jgi:hypothetical protein
MMMLPVMMLRINDGSLLYCTVRLLIISVDHEDA